MKWALRKNLEPIFHTLLVKGSKREKFSGLF